MADLGEVLDQAGYRDDGLPISFGPWANAWCPVWESSPPRAVSEQMFARMEPLPGEAEVLGATEAQKLTSWSAA